VDLLGSPVADPVSAAAPSLPAAVSAAAAPAADPLDFSPEAAAAASEPLVSTSAAANAQPAEPESASQAAPQEVEAFAIGDEDEEDPYFGSQAKDGDDFWAKPGGAAAAAPADPIASLEPKADAKAAVPVVAGDDWYLLNAEDASELEQRIAAGEGQKDTAKDTTGSKSSKKGASALWSSAKKFGTKARKAIVEEAKLVAEDARDLAEGVREGVQLTAQDAKVLQEKMKHEAKNRGWHGVLGGASSSSSKPEGARLEDTQRIDPEVQDDLLAAISAPAPVPEETAPVVAPSSAAPAEPGSGQAAAEEKLDPFKAIRQGLAATAEVSREMWRDIREVNQDVVSEVKLSVADMRKAVDQIPLIVGSGKASPSDKRPEGPEEAQGAAEAGDVERRPSGRVAVTSPLEAFDELLGAAVSTPGDSSPPAPDQRSMAEWRYDEQARAAAELSQKVAQATSGLFDGLKHGLMPYFGTHDASAGAAARSSAAAPERFWLLPSARANFVQLVFPIQEGCFLVAVVKDRDGVKLGLGIEDQGGVPVIDCVREGLVAEWNSAHPDDVVNVGDSIVEVNGAPGTYQELTAMMKSNRSLDLLVRHGQAPPAEEAAVPVATAAAVAASVEKGSTAAVTAEATTQAASADNPSSPEAKAPNAAQAARRMRKLAGGFASRTKKAIASKAQEVGQVIQDTATAPMWRPGGGGPEGEEAGAAAQAGHDDDDIFEIGDDGEDFSDLDETSDGTANVEAADEGAPTGEDEAVFE